MLTSTNIVASQICDSHSIAESLPTPQELPLNDDTNLLHLNDDCLLEILQYLTINDTFSLLDNFGNRINDIAYKRISQLKCLNFTLRNPPTFTPSQLQIIGKHLKTLNISVGYSLGSDRCISQYLNPLCYHGSIQNLTLNYVQFNNAYQECVLNLAPNLRSLDLSFCQLTDKLLQPIVENCIQLETLVIIGNYEWEGKSLHHFKSRRMQSITIELNNLCDDDVKTFKAVRGEVCLTVYEKGRSSCQIFDNVSDIRSHVF